MLPFLFRLSPVTIGIFRIWCKTKIQTLNTWKLFLRKDVGDRLNAWILAQRQIYSTQTKVINSNVWSTTTIDTDFCCDKNTLCISDLCYESEMSTNPVKWDKCVTTLFWKVLIFLKENQIQFYSSRLFVVKIIPHDTFMLEVCKRFTAFF